MFEVTSRYYAIEATTLVVDGREVRYVRRRFLPTGAPSTVLAVHSVAQGDRLDNITARYLTDPEQFWRVCDANGAMRPDELTAEPDRRLMIPVPDGGA